jgi:pimeloyl-ACP methyl ester carboxylesterase
MKGPDKIRGGLVEVAPYAAPLMAATRVPLSYALAAAVRVLRPLVTPIIRGYAVVQPRGDKELLARPEFEAMFLDDLLNASRYQMGAPLSDIILFTRDWGFEAADVQVPVRWWHGDADHIIPHSHGVHMASRLPNAVFATIDGESHLGGMGMATEVLQTLMELGPRKVVRKRVAAGVKKT